MQEESKEDYLARHRKELGILSPDEEMEEGREINKKPGGIKIKLKSIFFLLLFALFLWTILQIFGMLSSN